ncbi:hypothetical protein C8F04DRAFT_1132749 [Mycena alexandri]|uniref:Uncharacterized protein n=1 Tax=Mycena alexandri TaxID=1745969 RepID=A0AAD6SEJ0_9AGAR|nr:hypothetical protein C8F04DRAFT_1132749 [Mycena alexandri]
MYPARPQRQHETKREPRPTETSCQCAHPRLLPPRPSRARCADILVSTRSPSRARLALHPSKDAPRHMSSSPSRAGRYRSARHGTTRAAPAPRGPDSTRIEHPAHSQTLPTWFVHLQPTPSPRTLDTLHRTCLTHRTPRLRADSHASNTPLAHPTQHLDQRGPKGRSTPHLVPSRIHHPRPVPHQPRTQARTRVYNQPLKSTSPRSVPGTHKLEDPGANRHLDPRRARTLPRARTTQRTLHPLPQTPGRYAHTSPVPTRVEDLAKKHRPSPIGTSRALDIG